MNRSLQQFGLRTISGEGRGVASATLRAGLAIVEPIYRGVIGARNAMFDRGLRAAHSLGRATISVGNLTTGGTGKTPVVRWLAEALATNGRRPAVLLRGYAARGDSDERRMLADALGANVIVRANPSRIAGAAEVLREDAKVDAFVLDDAFQHRQAKRDFDLVLIDATQPFGFEHVLPRGLLREPIGGLRRADAVLITRSDRATAEELAKIEQRVRKHVRDGNVPIYRTIHAADELRCGDKTRAVGELRGKRVLAVCGIGNPNAFFEMLASAGATIVQRRAMSDHHHYESGDVRAIVEAARAANAEWIVTTEKDWTKIGPLVNASDVPAWVRLGVRVKFVDPAEEARLMAMIISRLGAS